MKKNIIRTISLLLLSIMFLQNAFALDEETQKSYAAETIGRVPKKYQTMVNGNWAIASGEFSEDGYYHFNDDDGKVEIDKYNIYGKKQYTTEYDYKYAGKDKNSLLNFRLCSTDIKFINDKGETFFSSHTLRMSPLLQIHFPSKSNVVKIDSKGNVLFEKILKSKEAYLIKDILETSDGNLILGVTKRTKWIGDAIDGYRAALIKLSADGEIIKQVELKEGITVVSNLVYVEGKGFFAQTSEIIDKENYITRVCLNAFDDKLNLLWEYEINSIFYTWNGDDVLENGYPVIAKKSKDTALYQTKENTIVRLDFDKNILSKYTFETEGKNEYVGNIEFLDNGEYIVEYGRLNQNNSATENSRYIRYSQGFRNLGELKIPGYSIYNLIETKNERIFCCWNALNYDDNGGVGDRECVYTAFDKDWNLLWQKGTKE